MAGQGFLRDAQVRNQEGIMELDCYGRPAFSDDDINHLTPIVYGELHEDFKVNPTLVVVGDGWIYCTAEFQRCWEEAIQRALVRAASGEGEKGPSALVLKALLNRRMEREPDFYTLAGILCDQLVRHYEPWTGLPGMDRPWDARSQRTRQIWAVSMRKALARTGLSSENPKPDDYRFFLPRKSDASTLLRFQVMELEAKKMKESETPASTPSEQSPPPAPPTS
jgi:hypothetical protein